MKNKKAILLVAACAALSAVAGVLLSMQFNRKVERTVSEASQISVPDATVEKDGVVYEPDSGVRAYLFLGVDDEGLDRTSYGKGGRTDTILLLVRRDEELRILEISRDTMTEVDTYDAAGDYLSTGVMQLNMQYSFGDSPRRSAHLTKRAVSNLLKGAEIDGAIALDMSGIAPIVDALGGITVRMEADCSYIDPTYIENAEIHMDGQAAERFIRWRDTSVSGSNDARMSRHTWFIRQMLAQSGQKEITALLKVSEPFLNTDMTAEELKSLYDCMLA